ncbi:MAG: flagellar biosynthetic protein FliO [Bdellovibrionales bacterium]|nr:flagellar biosynthetic protein FliO [Bdellovibrionales bacterium]
MKKLRSFFGSLLLLMLISEVCFALPVEPTSEKTKLEQVRELHEQNLENGGKPSFSKWSGSEENSLIASGGKMISGLALCLGVLIFGSGLYRRFCTKKGSLNQGKIKLIERFSLTTKTSLVLVEVCGKPQLVAVGGENVVFAGEAPKITAKENFDFDLQEACAKNQDISIT